MKILFTGGGTGGHIMPIVAIGRELRKLSPESELHYAGPRSDFLLLSEEGFKTHAIAAGKLRRYFSFQNFIDLLFKIPFSFLQGLFLLLFVRPKLVFSKGGTGSLAVTYSARILKIPVFVHESDMVPGLSNKISSRWAEKVFVSFEETEYFSQKKVTVVGNPTRLANEARQVRKELLGQNIEESKKIFGILSNKPVILVLGGSQGAQPINDFMLLVLNDLLRDYEVIHVAGSNNYKKVKIQFKIVLLSKELESYYHLYEFLNEAQLKDAYLASSLIVSRAGSGSIFEIAAAGKPSILIPLPGSANNHQSKNAYTYAKTGAAIVIEQGDLSSSFFMGELMNMLSESEKMKTAALKFSRPDAAKKIAEEIIQFLNEKEIS